LDCRFQVHEFLRTQIHGFLLNHTADSLDVSCISNDMKKSTALTPLASGQIRAARALVRWTAEDLARASAVGVATIRRAELTEHQTSLTAANDLAIRNALEAAGVQFIAQNGGGIGVRLRQPMAMKQPKP
jgi:hypothetical protein